VDHAARYRPAVLRPGVGAVIASVALVLGAAQSSRAQSVSDSPSANSPTTIAFFVPAQLPLDTRNALEDALVTQLEQLPALLHYEIQHVSAVPGSSPIDAAKRVAREQHAIAAFWLDVRTPSAWFLYALDARAERIVVRPLTSHATSQEAVVETVALIVRATADALLHGQPLLAAAAGSSTALEIPGSDWPVALAPTPNSTLRVSVAYVGETFAHALPWQSGLAVRGDWLWPSGPYLGLGYTFVPLATFDLAPVRFTLDRYPFSAHAGLRFAQGQFTFSGELGAEIESRTRRTLSAAADFDPDPARRKTIYNVCPKLESEFTVAPWFRIFAGVGLDIVLGNFAYTTKNKETQETRIILDPYGLRLSLHAGIAIIR
jgi:hypothetical protein